MQNEARHSNLVALRRPLGTKASFGEGGVLYWSPLPLPPALEERDVPTPYFPWSRPRVCGGSALHRPRGNVGYLAHPHFRYLPNLKI